MSTVEKHVCYTPGQLMDRLRTYLAHALAGVAYFGVVSEVTVTTYLGYRALVCLTTSSGTPERDETLILATLKAGEAAPPDWFVNSRGWDGSIWAATGDPGTAPFAPPWVDLKTAWIDLLISIKMEIINEWSTGEAGEIVIDELTFASGKHTNAVAHFSITHESMMVSVETIQTTDYESGATVADRPHTQGAQGPVGSTVLMTGDTGVESAIRELANIDTSISLNGGQAIYSVRSREVDEG